MGLPTAHRVTTAHLQAAYPFMSEGGLGGRGVYIGRDLFGGAFCYDPWELYAAGVVSNPNALIAGQVGRGKSALVKSYLARQRVFGRQAVVLSPKPGEYDALAAAMGTTPIALYPGGHVRLNPLDEITAGVQDPAAVDAHRETLLVSLAEAAVARALQPEEVAAVGLALAAATPESDGTLILPAVVDALLRPTQEAAAQIAVDVDTLAHDGRKAGLALRRLVTGDLRGMFDAPTTPGVALGGPLTLIDLSRMYSSPALGILMLCANAWQQAAVTRADTHGKWISVCEEAWAILRYPAVARALQESYKLARSYGVQNILVLHRLSDLEATGAAGSETRALAQGLLEDTETRVILAQPPGELDAATRLLGLSDAEAALLPVLPKARALWKIADRSFLVDHRLSPDEWALIDTDHRMRLDEQTVNP